MRRDYLYIRTMIWDRAIEEVIRELKENELIADMYINGEDGTRALIYDRMDIAAQRLQRVIFNNRRAYAEYEDTIRVLASANKDVVCFREAVKLMQNFKEQVKYPHYRAFVETHGD